MNLHQALEKLKAHQAWRMGDDREMLYPDELTQAINRILQVPEDIMQAFVAGDQRGTGDIPFNAEQYYSQTFTNETNNNPSR